MKKVLLVFLIFLPLKLFSATPIAGILDFKTTTPLTFSLKNILEQHLTNILYSSGVFDLIKYKTLQNDLDKYGCTDEKCILQFAKDAGISLLINGEIEDRKNYILINFRAYGTSFPHNGTIIVNYSVKIPVNKNFNMKKQSYIIEEHSATFIVNVLNKFLKPIFLEDKNFQSLKTLDALDGQYDLYRFENKKSKILNNYTKIEKIKIKDGFLISQNEFIKDDFLMIGFKDKAKFIEDFYYGRKKEIVFEKQKFETTLFKLLFTVPASITMPVVAPFAGYYKYGDWEGLSLWSFNVMPYLYLEYDGFKRNPDDSRKLNYDISNKDKTRKRFFYYMAFIGGLPLFVDAFSHQYLNRAKEYDRKEYLMGNTYSVFYLSLISGGGGHFYRGYRSWGYLFFHINNILVYNIIGEASQAEHYNELTNRYEKNSINKKKLYSLIGLYSSVKIFEIVHALLLKDNIRNGEVQKSDLSFEPDIKYDLNYGYSYGMKLTAKF